MNLNNSNIPNYQTKEKKYNRLSVIEHKPVYSEKELKEKHQYITQRCIELLKKIQ